MPAVSQPLSSFKTEGFEICQDTAFHAIKYTLAPLGDFLFLLVLNESYAASDGGHFSVAV